MRHWSILLLLSFSLGASGQSLLKSPQSSTHYFFYKLNYQQAWRYFTTQGRVPLDSVATQLVAKVHTDSLSTLSLKEKGYYLRVFASGHQLTYAVHKENYFHYRTRGFNGEGHLYLYDPSGKN